jgi:signal transduction histidine kinase/ligand-binding sensor domain-containing protein/CheY-like chemotaxis protein
MARVITSGRIAFALLVSVLVFSWSGVFSQRNNRTFLEVAPDALSSSFVRCIFKDSKGFMWFGTATGLVRYDGSNVYRYEHSQDNPHSITDNRINAIIEDSNQNLWIGTAYGLVMYDRKRDHFVDVNKRAENTNELNGAYIAALCKDSSGRIWIGTHGQGINVYDPRTFTFSYIAESGSSAKPPSANYITSLLAIDGKVWAGTKGGLRLFDSRELVSQSLLPGDKDVSTEEVTHVVADNSKQIWIAKQSGEVIKVGYKGGSFTIEKRIGLSNGRNDVKGTILTLASDIAGNLWVAGENFRLTYLDTKSFDIDVFEPVDQDPKSIPTYSIRSVYVDDTGKTWIGTYNKGALLIDNKAKKFETYERYELAKAGLSADNVKGICEDRSGNIWISVGGGGLGMLDSKTRDIKFDKRLNNAVGTRHLSALMVDKHDNVWAGSWGQGVFKINPKTKAVKNFKIGSRGFGEGKIFCIYQDSRENIWVGSAGSGLFKLDKISGTFLPMNDEVKKGYLSKTSYVTTIVEDRDSTLWVGTLFGLYRLVPARDLSYDALLYPKSDSAGYMRSYDIQTIRQDSSNDLWIGTGDNGVAIFCDSMFSSLQTKDGLPSNAIRGMLEDRKGNVWISTNRGLVNYDPATKVFRNYTANDGLPSNDFNTNAMLAATDGTFYFGTDKGLLAFHPDSIQINNAKPLVYLTDLKLNNQSAPIGEKDSPLTKHIGLTEAIELSHTQRSFSLEFVAINYGLSSRNQYAYKLEGFDDEWIHAGPASHATFTNLDPGTYTFLVKAMTNDGIWSDSPTKLKITIHQAPWKSWWAQLIYVLTLLSVIYVVVKIRVERLHIRNQLELEKIAREQEHALSESKTQFFTNISHEFRTPLSLIAMPLESLLSTADVPHSVRQRLETMQMNTEKMLRLVNELMDFSKLESAKMKLAVHQGDVFQFVAQAASAFDDLARKRDIHFCIHRMDRALHGWFDADKLEKIVVNILSNAFKFTADGGVINVILSSRELEEGKAVRWLEFKVVDNGLGIAQEELPHIFDKFYQAKSSARIANPGTGVGLALTKSLVELHHGRISAASIPDRETTFVLQLPIDRSAYNNEEVSAHEMARMESPAEILQTSDHLSTAANHPDTMEDSDRPRILLVDDNDELRKYISLEFGYHFNVIQGRNGEEGLQLAFERTPDLIVSDVLMPLKSGIELCRELKSNLKTSHIPVILLTAKSAIEDQLEGVTSGADAYVTKPFNVRLLIAQILQIIEARQNIYQRFSQDVYLMPAKVATNEIDQAFLQKAITFIVDNLQDSQLGVDSIAELFALSRMQVYRKIKALTGKSVVDFIRMVRIKEALKLMDTHKYTLAEIAFQTGFSSPSYFTRCFKDQFGKAPSEYLQAGSFQHE